MSTSNVLESLGVQQVVGVLMDNHSDIKETANSLGVKTSDLKAKMDEWDEEYAGTQTIDTAIASHINTRYSGESNAYGKLNQLINSTVPTNLSDKFNKAVQYKKTDDVLAPMIRTKVNFLKSGFRVTAEDDEQQAAAKAWLKSRKIANSFIPKCAESIFLNEQSAVLWNSKSKSLTVLPLANLKVIDLHAINDDGSPKFITYMKLPKDIVDLIKKLKEGSKELKNFPEDWILAAKRGRKLDPEKKLMPAGPWVELGAKDKDKVFILSLGGEDATLIDPSVVTIFPSLELRRFLQDGEFSTAYLNKYFIHQIKTGSKTQGGSFKDLLAAKPDDPATRQATLNAYTEAVDKAIVTVTDQDEEHVFLFPGSEIQFDKRYVSPDTKILFWGGISHQIMTDAKGGSFSGGLIYMKSYSKMIDAARDLIAEVLETVTGMMNIEGASYKWNENYMKEPKQVLAEVTFMTSRGQDMEMAIQALGYDWDEWVAKREKTLSPEELGFKGKKDKEHLYWQALQIPFFEDHQGQLDEGGRPEDDGAQTDNTNAEPQPRTDL